MFGRVLGVETTGPPGAHHFYITFNPSPGSTSPGIFSNVFPTIRSSPEPFLGPRSGKTGLSRLSFPIPHGWLSPSP